MPFPGGREGFKQDQINLRTAGVLGKTYITIFTTFSCQIKYGGCFFVVEFLFGVFFFSDIFI